MALYGPTSNPFSLGRPYLIKLGLDWMMLSSIVDIILMLCDVHDN